MQKFQTWYFEGNFDQQREQEQVVESIMTSLGYITAFRHVRTDGLFVVYFREG